MAASVENVTKTKLAKTQTFNFGPWIVSATKGTILTSAQVERHSAELGLPALPDMVFGENELSIKHQAGFGINFNALDALKHVDNKHDLMKVAISEEWLESAAENELVTTEIVKPYDWTYTTDYKGTLISNNGFQMKVVPTNERIDLEKLKVKEKIFFYEDMMLFEDELADNGSAFLNVKMRVMQDSFFLLLRFFLRVDGVLVRINDTRLYHKAGTNHFLREYSCKEKKVSELKCPYSDPSTVSEYLTPKDQVIERLEFPWNTEDEVVQQAVVSKDEKSDSFNMSGPREQR